MKSCKHKKCLLRFACLKLGIIPRIGDCSIPADDKRLNALKDISGKLTKEGSRQLRKVVVVTNDFMGMSFPFAAKRVYRPEGYDRTSLCFALGKDEYGEEILTDHLSTEDIINIKNNIK